jgi:superfamily II DNA/RNA helicase
MRHRKLQIKVNPSKSPTLFPFSALRHRLKSYRAASRASSITTLELSHHQSPEPRTSLSTIEYISAIRCYHLYHNSLAATGNYFYPYLLIMGSSLCTKYFIILMAACVVARTCSFVSTSIISSSSVKPISAPPPYKGACTLQQQSSSSSSSPRSRPYSSKKGYKKQQKQQTRNRGANQADHNRRGHEFRLNKDNTGGGGGKQRVRKTNTKRPPRWEREGDNLYQEVSKQHEHLQLLAQRRVSTVQDVCDVLAPWMTSNDNDAEVHHQRKAEIEKPEQAVETNEDKKTPPFLWGSLPVGPVIATRLRSSNRSSPTSVQCAAFTMLTATQSKNNKNVPTKRTNAIIASPTGTGKTLAYLLPLLCTSPGGQKGEGTGGVLIVTPTIELACQIQREVDVLWPPSENEKSSLFVVGANEMGASAAADDDDDDEEEDVWSQGRIILRSIIGNKPLIAGTPKMLRMLYREAENIVKRPDDVYPFTKEERETSIALLSNLRAIVLDEADRLLRTEAVARETAERKQRKIEQQRRAEAEELAPDNYSRTLPPPRKKRLIIARQTQTELLLRDLPVPSLDDIQIICASATIGRTMRRQLMQILGAPSADAAAALITGDEDARVKSKDAEKRKSVLLPEKLQHVFKVVDISCGDEGDKDDEELSVAERNEERRIAATIQGMWDTMVTMEVAKPTIIFPGRVGVERVQEELKALGLQDVRTLRNLSGDSHEANNGSAKDDVTETNSWKHIPVYIIGERFARGLDLPEVGNVILLTPPSSAAGYAHMAGRTGRSGREGTAITLVRPKNNEVQRLSAIAETLGLKFKQELSGVAGTQ